MNSRDSLAMECSNKLTELLEYICLEEFAEEMVVAREIFMLLTGKVNDDDPGYEQRMQCFQEFFLFEHRLSAPFAGQTIFERFLQESERRLTADQMLLFEQFRSAGRSLFVIEKIMNDHVIARDLMSGRVQAVYALDSFSLHGLPSAQIFEARTVQYLGLVFFTGAFIFHPQSVTDLIEKMNKAFLSGGAQVLQGSGFEDAPSKDPWDQLLQEKFEKLKDLHQRRERNGEGTRSRAVDHLTLTQKLVDAYRLVSALDRVTSIGQNAEKRESCFIPESPLRSRTAFLDILAQCEVKCLRYRHIEPLKVYAQALSRDSSGIYIQRPEKSEEAEVVRASRALA